MGYNKYRIMFKLIRVATIILFCLFIAVTIFFINGFMEKGAVKSIISEYKKRGEYTETIVIQGQKVDLYKVFPKYDYEEITNRNTFDPYKGSDYYIGSSTDIILTTRNPLRLENTAIVRDFGAYFSSNFFIGHATINVSDDGKYYVESVGNVKENNGVRKEENSWILTELRSGNDAQIIIGLRLKNTTFAVRKQICDDVEALVGNEYNMNIFVSKKDKYYCTDLITRTLRKNDIRVNYDFFYPTGNDIIISNNTYPIFLCERIEDGYFEIYYMCEE